MTDEMTAAELDRMNLIEHAHKDGCAITDDGFTFLIALAREALAGRDDPSMDATDYAHPAWWRGNEAGVLGAVSRIREAIEMDDGEGVLGGADLERLRRDVLAGRERLRLAEAVCEAVLRDREIGDAYLSSRWQSNDLEEAAFNAWMSVRNEASVAFAAWKAAKETVRNE